MKNRLGKLYVFLSFALVFSMISCNNISQEIKTENTKTENSIKDATPSQDNKLAYISLGNVTVGKQAARSSVVTSTNTELLSKLTTVNLECARTGDDTPVNISGNNWSDFLSKFTSPGQTYPLQTGSYNFTLTATLQQLPSGSGVAFSASKTNINISSDTTEALSFTLAPTTQTTGGIQITWNITTNDNILEQVNFSLKKLSDGTTTPSSVDDFSSGKVVYQKDSLEPGEYELTADFRALEDDFNDPELPPLSTWKGNVRVAAGITTIAEINWALESVYEIEWHLTNGTLTDAAYVQHLRYTRKSDTITLPAVTPSAGYSFDGWYGADDYSGSELTSIQKGSTGPKALYAKITPINYTIHWENMTGASAGSTGTMPDSYNIESSTITLPTAPTKTGFTFAGWYTNSTLTTAASSTIPSGSTGEKYFYAKWTYKVTFNVNGGSEVAEQTLKAGVTPTEPEAPTKTGYTFDGWFTTSTFTASSEYTFSSASSSGNLTLYAKWTLATYTITYHCIGGNSNATEFTINSSTITLSAPSGADPDDPALNANSYYFKGWYKNSAYSGDEVTEIPSGSHEDMDLYAAQSNNIHVSSTGLADNDGLFSTSPVNSIATAVQKIVGYSTKLDWVIIIDDNIIGTQVVNNSSLTSSKASSLSISGNYLTPPTLNGGSLTEGDNRTTLTINTTLPVTISNLSITGGRGTVDSGKYYGGGIYVAANSKVTLDDGVKIYGNSCDFGAGVYVAAGAVLCMSGTAIIGDTEKSSSVSTVNDLYSISSNVSGAYSTWSCANYAAGNSPTPGGGGIYNLGTVALGYSSYTDETTNNTSTLTGGIYNNASIRGGGIAMPSGGNLIISSGNIMYNAAVQSNTGGMGGGIYAKMASIVTFNDGKINNNYSSGSSAGVYLYCVNATDSGLATSGFYMNGGEIKNNHSFSNIAAVNCDRATFVMTGGTISGNKAHVTESNNETNGGIRIYGGTSSITGGTIKDNYDNNGNVTVAIDGDSDFTLGGTAEIPFDSGVANSIFSDSITITVSSPVTNSFTLIKWSSPDPSGYSTPPVILTGGNTSDYSKFSLTYNPAQQWTGTWVVGSDGTAQPGS